MNNNTQEEMVILTDTVHKKLSLWVQAEFKPIKEKNNHMPRHGSTNHNENTTQQ